MNTPNRAYEDPWWAFSVAARAAMTELGVSIGDLAKATRLSRETLRPILNGVPGNYRSSTISKVSLGLGWPGDIAGRIIAGTYIPSAAIEAGEPPITSDYLEISLPPTIELKAPGHLFTDEAYSDSDSPLGDEYLDVLREMAEKARGTARWVGPTQPPPRLAAALARFALSDANFAQAAKGGPTETQTETVDKIPAERGYDPDED